MKGAGEAARLIGQSEMLLRDVLVFQDKAARAAQEAMAERAELVAALRAMVERMEEDLDEMASERGFPAVPISWLESPPLATARALLARIDAEGGV